MGLCRVNGAAGCGGIAGGAAHHVEPQHRHPVLKIDKVLAAGGDRRAGMFDKPQISRRIVGEDQPVWPDLDLAIGHLQGAPEQDRHAGHMQDVALVTCRLPMREIEPGKIDQRWPRPHEAERGRVQCDQRHPAEFMAALLLLSPTAARGMPQRPAGPVYVAHRLDRLLAKAALRARLHLADADIDKPGRVPARPDQLRRRHQHEIRIAPVLRTVDKDMDHAVDQQRAQQHAGKASQRPAFAIERCCHLHQRRRGIGKGNRPGEGSSGKGLDCARQAVEQHRPAKSGAPGCPAFIVFPRQPSLAATPHRRCAAHQIGKQVELRRHRPVRQSRGGD